LTASTHSIIIMGIAYKPLSLLLIPLLIYRETRDWIIDGLYSLVSSQA